MPRRRAEGVTDVTPPSSPNPTTGVTVAARRANGAAGPGPVRLDPHPALAREAQERARSLQNRPVDRITAFAGSMAFVYIHIVWFGCWIGLGVEHYPYGLLTLIVSLEAIFLSTFVMISQNRADAKRRLIADQQWQTVQAENEQNEELLGLTRETLEL